MSDINKTTHSGTAITTPSFISMGKTPMVVFSLKVKEEWKNKQGVAQHRFNIIKFEVLGKNFSWAKENIKIGKRYLIDGYVRSDIINGKEDTRVRAFRIQEDTETAFKDGYIEGLRKSFAIMDNSDDLVIASSKLKLLLEI